jgi:KDO2-lipid IV(A) lauroyltransferase
MTAAATASPAARPVRLSDRIEYAVFRAALACLSAVPRRVALRAGALLGTALYCVAVRPRRVGLFNLKMALPDAGVAAHRRILRASCRNLGRTAGEFCHLPQLDVAALSDIVSFADRAAWERAIAGAEQTGAVILTAHFGNWELLAYAHGLLGHPITLVHRPLRNPLVDDAVNAIRSRAGTRAIKKKAAAKEALRTLKGHGLVVIPADQNQTRTAGIFVDFFGVPACTTPGVARLAMLTGAPVLPVFLVRDGEGPRHRIEILPAVEMVATGDRDADIRTNTQRCTSIVEEMIRRYPEQWIWFHKRWKTRPLGEPRLYQ